MKRKRPPARSVGITSRPEINDGKSSARLLLAQAAKHAILRWHYSRKMPSSKLVRIGVWEARRFVGAILYGCGANRHLARPFGLQSTEACELVRVALASGRAAPTSKCLAISLRLLKKQSPGLRVIVSYADLKEGHVGTVYQACGWFFVGGSEQAYLKVRGRIEHPRSLYDRYGRQGQSVPWLRQHVDPNAKRVPMPAKLKYVWPFDPRLRVKLEEIAKPYPKRAGSIDSDVSAIQAEEGGATPTSALHIPSTR